MNLGTFALVGCLYLTFLPALTFANFKVTYQLVKRSDFNKCVYAIKGTPDARLAFYKETPNITVTELKDNEYEIQTAYSTLVTHFKFRLDSDLYTNETRYDQTKCKSLMKSGTVPNIVHQDQFCSVRDKGEIIWDFRKEDQLIVTLKAGRVACHQYFKRLPELSGTEPVRFPHRSPVSSSRSPSPKVGVGHSRATIIRITGYEILISPSL